MIIRKAEIKDLEEIAILIKQVSDLHYQARKNMFKLKDLKEIEKYLESIIDCKEVKIIVAEDNKIVCRSNYIYNKRKKRAC